MVVTSADLTILIPTLPSRSELLRRVVKSIADQTVTASVMIEADLDGEGAAATRNRMLEKVHSEWVAFVDDDDYLLPNHIEVLWEHRHDADLVYTDHEMEHGGTSPVPRLDYTPNRLKSGNFIPVTVMARTSHIRRAGMFPVGVEYEDWRLWLHMEKNGSRFKFVPIKTWVWNHAWGGNTAGQV